jgi:hypothetical protein
MLFRDIVLILLAPPNTLLCLHRSRIRRGRPKLQAPDTWPVFPSCNHRTTNFCGRVKLAGHVRAGRHGAFPDEITLAFRLRPQLT